MKAAIIDYQLSNLFSVLNACLHAGLDAAITSEPNEVRQAELLILPGVGTFGDAMNNLQKLSLDTVIKQQVNRGVPFVGICLGMQLLFEQGEEFGEHAGLSLIPGRVVRFPDQSRDKDLRIPHIGWNTIFKPQARTWLQTPLAPLPDQTYMYFVHSYYPVPADKSVVLSYTDYNGVKFCSSVLFKNIAAFQFHPEKSGHNGLLIYQGLKKWAGK